MFDLMSQQSNANDEINGRSDMDEIVEKVTKGVLMEMDKKLDAAKKLNQDEAFTQYVDKNLQEFSRA